MSKKRSIREIKLETKYEIESYREWKEKKKITEVRLSRAEHALKVKDKEIERLEAQLKLEKELYFENLKIALKGKPIRINIKEKVKRFIVLLRNSLKNKNK